MTSTSTVNPTVNQHPRQQLNAVFGYFLVFLVGLSLLASNIGSNLSP